MQSKSPTSALGKYPFRAKETELHTFGSDRLLTLLSIVLLVLLCINYTVVTVVLKDATLAKYMRDIVLVVMLIVAIAKREFVFPTIYILPLLFISIACFCFFESQDAEIGIVVCRRYVFPLMIFLVAVNIKRTKAMIIAPIVIVASLAAWGLFQVWILGDSFLEQLGYPLSYSPFYRRNFLGNSFYFGGLGIQRVVSTFSSANIFALIMGITLIHSFFNRDYFKNRILLIVSVVLILIAYVLTFSRSNFLALGIVVLLFWRHVPHKRAVFTALLVVTGLMILIAVGLGSESTVSNIANWISASITLSEDSAAGRSSRWEEALFAILNNPFGIGYGHTGLFASNDGLPVYSCENSYLSTALEFGWLGCVAYFSIFIALAIAFRNASKYYGKRSNRSCYYDCLEGTAILIYIGVVLFFSNHASDMEAMSLVFFYLGVVYQSYISISKNTKIV